MDTTPHRSAGARRRVLLAGAVTTCVLVAAWTGVALADGGGHGHRHRFGLAGVVGSVDDATRSFLVTTPSGRTATVTTTTATTYTATVEATAADAGAGSFVVAKGDRAADQSLAADKLLIVQTALGHKAFAGEEVVAGTVLANADTGTGRMLAVDVNGDSVADQTVTTSATTRALRIYDTTFTDVDAGDLVMVKGWRTAPGTFTALRVDLRAATKAAATLASAEVTTTTSTTTPSTTTSTAAVPVTAAASPAAAPAAVPAMARGTIASVGDAEFTVTRHDGDATTVHTSASTSFLKTVDATLADVAGRQVTVKAFGEEGGALVAARVRIHTTATENTTDGFCDDGRGLSGVASNVDTAAGTFTVAGRTVAVNGDTVITQTVAGSFADLAAGRHVKVFGTRQADGSIAASVVHVDLTSGHAGGFVGTRTWEHHDGDQQTTSFQPTGDRTWSGDQYGGDRWHH